MIHFEECYIKAIAAAHATPRELRAGECQTPYGKRCSLCHAVMLNYNDELRIKNSALKEFWNRNKLPTPIDPIIPSPLGRFYRTVTKRKVFTSRGKARLGLIGISQRNPSGEGMRAGAIDVIRCAIEPEAHEHLYARVQKFLDTTKDRHLAEALHYVVIKGSYDELTVILNVDSVEPDILKRVNVLSKTMTSSVRGITGVFLYHDEKRSRYYLPSAEGDEHSFRRVYGKKEIYQKITGRSFLYSPLSFSQINQSMVEEMIKSVETLLSPDQSMQLYDLYCGYGLFALSFAGKVASVTGVEISAASVGAAKSNAIRQHVKNVRFLCKDINEESMHTLLQKTAGRFSVILDPPRGGTAQGVIETIAARRPERVVHIFCDINRIPQELAQWQKSGYHPMQAVPLDMFPGTDDIEILLRLNGKQA